MTYVSILLCIFSCLVVYCCWILSQCGSSGYSMCLYSVILLKLLLLMKLMVYTLFNQTMYVSSLVSPLPPHYVYLSFTVSFPFPFLIYLLFISRSFSSSPNPSLPLFLYSNDSSILVPGTEPVKVIKPSGPHSHLITLRLINKRIIIMLKTPRH